MKKNIIREWKKVFETDLGYICYELKDTITMPAVIILEGAMGSGKTTFAKSFIEDTGTMSPSYSILSESENTLHADFYRIESSKDIIHLEIPLYLESKQFFLAEWGERFLKIIEKETPEQFSFYLMDISVNENTQSKNDKRTVFSRNFVLSELSEI